MQIDYTLALHQLAEAPAPVNGAANVDGVEAAQVFAALQAVEGGTVQMLGENVAQANHYALWRHLRDNDGCIIIHRNGHYVAARAAEQDNNFLTYDNLVLPHMGGLPTLGALPSGTAIVFVWAEDADLQL